MKKLNLSFFILCMLPNLGAANQYQEQVRDQLQVASLLFEGQGYERATKPFYDELDDEEVDSLTVRLNSAYDYKLIGFCDNDCPDLDLLLYDENDNLIDKDNSSDSTPIVSVSPSWSGEFTLKVRMFDCDDEPCYYGVVAYRR